MGTIQTSLSQVLLGTWYLVIENFCRPFSPNLTDCPWVSKDEVPLTLESLHIDVQIQIQTFR